MSPVRARHKAWRKTESERAWEKALRKLHEQKKALAARIDEDARRLLEAGVGIPMIPRENERLRAAMRNHRGHLAEERIVRLLNEPAERPAWLVEAMLGTPDVDMLGVDVVVVTRDLGPLALQVKSSTLGAEHFRSKHPDILEVVGVVIAPIEMADADARVAVMTELDRLRELAARDQGRQRS